jgi:hypothetical protein
MGYIYNAIIRKEVWNHCFTESNKLPTKFQKLKIKLISQYTLKGDHAISQTVAGISPWQPGFSPRSVHVGLMVNKVA